MGGAKVSDKLPIIRNLLSLADNIIITGGMAFTFLNHLHNMKIGSSLFESNNEKYIQEVIQEAQLKGVKLHFPTDFTISQFSNFSDYLKGGDLLSSVAPIHVTAKEGIPDGYLGLDIGPNSIQRFNEIISNSKCVALNGPSGLMEHPLYQDGTVKIMENISRMTHNDNEFISVIGGGDSVNSIRFCKEDVQFSHVSTGGGASLEMLEGKVLPGISALSDLE